ncbi:hypothetical protein FIU87_05445 [Bacillus sp. THAF10]|uniref:HEPN domain-containing protein n=1 Tax=Bacillus sp. THAF10 TaxID=2587848 RepID=UPI001267D30E|nr:HEPN domain-containing protein [Bacillus sp. THAF10]QFT88076.1 hypothetical protein FIU87_05445 [Bacillus sp. THAF10]
MKYFFVARIYGLKLNRTLNRGLQLDENLRLSTSQDKLERVCDKFFEDGIGFLEYGDLKAGPYVYAEGKYDYIENEDEHNRMNLLNYFMSLSQTLSAALWLYRDNSIRTEQGFIYIYDETKNTIENNSVSSNSRSTYFLDSKGGQNDTLFTYEEITAAVNTFKIFFNNTQAAPLDHTQTGSIVTTTANRIERFNYFLQAARNEGFLPNRISFYCTALETLLSTDNQEISHKISERMARMLGNDFPSRDKVFKFIKTAYSIRSSNVHGDKLSKNFRSIEKQREISTDLDEYIRQLFQKILSNDELMGIYIRDNIEELRQWFNELTLS